MIWKNSALKMSDIFNKYNKLNIFFSALHSERFLKKIWTSKIFLGKIFNGKKFLNKKLLIFRLKWREKWFSQKQKFFLKSMFFSKIVHCALNTYSDTINRWQHEWGHRQCEIYWTKSLERMNKDRKDMIFKKALNFIESKTKK